MNLVLVMLYIFIAIISLVILLFIVKYFKDKANNNTFVRDHILIDIAIWADLFVVPFATVIIAREICGQFQTRLFVDSLYYIQQITFECLLLSIVSLQLFQIMNIFQTATLREWRDEMLVNIQRIFVLLFGVPFGIFVCRSEGGICRSTSIYYYLLKATKEREKFEDSILSVISVIVFAVIIISCQIVVEMKRFQLNREEKKAERRAVLALKEIEKAKMRMYRDPILEIQVSKPALSNQMFKITDAELNPEESIQTTSDLSKHQVFLLNIKISFSYLT
jgi:hypothetical protein